MIPTTASIPHPSLEQEYFGRETLMSPKTQQMRATLDGLKETGGKLPQVLLNNDEQPIVMLAAFMAAAGRTRTEICAAVGRSPTWLQNIRQQPAFKKRVEDMCREAGKDMVKATLEGMVLPSIETLNDICQNPNERSSARVAAANSILDRFLGKPVVTVESSTKLNISTAASTADSVKHELEQIDAELKARGVILSRS